VTSKEVMEFTMFGSGILYYAAFCFYRQWMQNKEEMKRK